MKRNSTLFIKLCFLSLAFTTLTGFDFLDDINKKVSSALTSESGGIPVSDVSLISKSVISSRKAAPNLSASLMPFEPLQSADAVQNKPSTALKGEGKEINDASSHAVVELALDKENYQSGRLVVNLNGGDAETYRIIGSKLFGKHDDKKFEFIYLLATPQNELVYFSLISSTYDVNGKTLRGFEGTLLYPAKDSNWNEWEKVYKINFGFDYSVPPAYQRSVEIAKIKVKEMRDSLQQAKTMNREINGLNAKAEKKAGTPEGEKAALDAKEESRILNEGLLADQKRILGYYRLYQEIISEYQALTKTNFFSWYSLKAQQSKFNVIEELDDLNKSMESVLKGYQEILPDTAEITAAKEEAANSYNTLK